MVEPSVQIDYTKVDDRGDLDLCKQIEVKDAQIKKLCAEIGNLEFQITDYQQIVRELSERLSKYETLHGTVFVKGPKK
jgi:uncharacterized protein YlxW (UPF0749 family)